MDDLAGVKPKADKLNINELKTVPVDLNKWSTFVNNGIKVVKLFKRCVW